uniref:Cytochrome c biogenesis protein transmembrane region n=1 Tax=Calliarthron tuberculosum TaxID=48942 RepID=M4IU28_CALTB|nr:cytochrome c biogenesis protein transmembrane region [Calliarthron tuberculosum]AGA63748.1 cytochrome c biogenesis protein transmembrane region [Calliarthron tuberculosum]
MYIKLLNHEFSLYIFQQFVIRSLYLDFYLKQPAFSFFILLSGLISGCSPCIISVLPLVLGYINIDTDKKTRWSFLLGLTTTLILVLISFSFVANRYHYILIVIPFIAYLITITLGLFLLNILQVQIDTSLLDNLLSKKFDNVMKNFILGSILAINAAPCSTPILLTLVFILSFSSNHLLILSYISIYLLGYILPLLLIITFILRLRYSSRLSSIFSLSTSWSGCMMLSWGLLKVLESICL